MALTTAAVIGAGAAVYGATRKPPKVKVPKPDSPIAAPTIDDTVKERTETDRLRRRRGILGNIRTGTLGAPISPTNAPVKQLTGQ